MRRSCFLLLLTSALVSLAVQGPAGNAQQSPSGEGTAPEAFLPQESGQQWAEYDIRRFTGRWPQDSHPERLVVDWILRDTGSDVWFGSPASLLSVSRERVRVYHTPDVLRQVEQVVERFVEPRCESYALAARILTVGSPNWRSRAWPLMQSVSVSSPGVDAWLLSRENAALLLADLRKRADTVEYNLADLLIPHGQTHTLQRRQARHYARNLKWREQGYPPYEIESGVVDDGFSLQISPLLTTDCRQVDAVVRCYIDQVEKFVPVLIDVPLPGGTSQRVQLEVPQIVSWRLYERFRWPSDQVLLLSCGVVASPEQRPSGFGWVLAGSPGRADALLFLECRTISDPNRLVPAIHSAQGGDISRGRY
ncbi:MAG: hypothetical protein KatS3mg109_0319 [Pirellulaceae bacterium]|nr:MAG: hypothetical protein KatS3mg109_0319 [Pirellulaceae bacterium]GIW96529.1 MAG: hypothetical protein KatS3mg110_4570 [Pirellulaceae bacterium]